MCRREEEGEEGRVQEGSPGKGTLEAQLAA